MATADSVKNKIQGLIDTANQKTGKSDIDLTSAVNSLAIGYEDIWEIIQNHGNRTDYQNAFAYADWDDNNFKPKYNIKVVGSGANLFRGTPRITDLEAALDRAGVVLDTSEATNLNNAFSNYNLTVIPEIDVQKAVYSGSANLSIQPAMKIIRKIISSENTNWHQQAFRYAYGLENVIFDGVIGSENLNLQWSTKLNKESIVSIINCLSIDSSGLTVTISIGAVNVAFETGEGLADGSESEEWKALVATKPNWTISLA